MESEIKEPMSSSKKKVLFSGLAVIIIAAIVVIVIMLNKKPSEQQVGEQQGVQANENQTEMAEAETPDASIDINDDSLKEVEVADMEGTKVVVVGANPITKDNKVVTPDGVITENTVLPMSDNAPKQTGFLNKEELPDGVVKISVGNGKFAPSQFTTKSGAPTTFSLTGVDDYSHVIAFKDPAMSAIAILVGPGQTKAITFNAPTTAGEYVFYCASPGHEGDGETGKMIVK